MSRTAIRDKKPVRRAPKSRADAPSIVEANAPAPEPVVESSAPAEAIAPVCVHRWVIESPNGETSRGVCRHCGAVKEFPNAAEDGLWERNVPQSRWTGRTEWKPSESGY
jgi:hypothetical protein